MILCNICDGEIYEGEERFVDDLILCEDCFSDRYTYCRECDRQIHRDDARYGEDGDPYCEDCYESNYEDDAPQNPEVFPSDRDLILKLSECWLEGVNVNESLIKVNFRDPYLDEIRGKVGLIDNPIYCFGLRDREEYQLSASEDILEDVKQYITDKNLSLKVTEGIGIRRLGIAMDLRTYHKDMIVKLIQSLCTEKSTAPVDSPNQP